MRTVTIVWYCCSTGRTMKRSPRRGCAGRPPRRADLPSPIGRPTIMGAGNAAPDWKFHCGINAVIMMTQCPAASVPIIEGRFEEPSMGRALRRIGGLEALGRGVALAAVALATAGCAAIQNAMPDAGLLHLPDRSTFFPTGLSSYTRPVSASGRVGPAAWGAGQGGCAAHPPMVGSSDAPPVGSRGVSLEMTECEVVRALG